MNRITMIVHNMRFLLLNDLLKDLLDATWSVGRVAFGLTAQRDEYASRNGKDRQDHAEVINNQTGYQAPSDEKDRQQDHADIPGDVHGAFCFLFFNECADRWWLSA
jgi:hypothetical protein